MKSKLKNLLFLGFFLSLFSYSCTEQEEYVNDDEILLETIGAEIPKLNITPETRANLEVKENYSGADYFLNDVLNKDLREREGGKLYVTATSTKNGEEDVIVESIYEYKESNGYHFFSNNPIKIKKGYEIRLDARFQVNETDVVKENPTDVSTKSYIYTKDVLIGDITVPAFNTLTQKEIISKDSDAPAIHFKMKHSGVLIQVKLLNYNGKKIESITFDGVEMYNVYKTKGEYFLIVNSESKSIEKIIDLIDEDGKKTSFPVNFDNGLENEKIYAAEIDLFDPNGKIEISTIDWDYYRAEKKITDQTSTKTKIARLTITDENGNRLEDNIKVYKANGIVVKEGKSVFSEENFETVRFDPNSECYFVYLNENYLTKIVYKSFDSTPYYFGIKPNDIKNDAPFNLFFNFQEKKWNTVEKNGITIINSVTDFLNIYKTLEIKNKQFLQAYSLYFNDEAQVIFDGSLKSVNFESSTYKGNNENVKLVNLRIDKSGLFTTSNNSKFINVHVDNSLLEQLTFINIYENVGLLTHESKNTAFENCAIKGIEIVFNNKSTETTNFGFFSGKSKNDTYNKCSISNINIDIRNVSDSETKLANLFFIKKDSIITGKGTTNKDKPWYYSYKSSPTIDDIENLYQIIPRINFGSFVGNGVDTKIYDSDITDVKVIVTETRTNVLSGVIGCSNNSLFKDFKINKLTIYSSESIAGGYVGKESLKIVCNNSSIENSLISGKYVGGFVGLNYNTKIDPNSDSEINYFTSKNNTIKGSKVVGGVFGILSTTCKLYNGNSDGVGLLFEPDYFYKSYSDYANAIAMGGLIGYYFPDKNYSSSSIDDYDLLIQGQKIHNVSFQDYNNNLTVKESSEGDDGRRIYYGHLIGDALLLSRATNREIERRARISEIDLAPSGRYPYSIGALPIGKDYTFYCDNSVDKEEYYQQNYTDITKYKPDSFTATFRHIDN